MTPAWKNILKWMLKAIVSLVALYFVAKKINVREALVLLSGAELAWLIPALLVFNISKLLSAERVGLLLEQAGVMLSPVKNSMLYYTGMFYNLFLPGGIGGDGYKIFLLNRHRDVPVRSGISIMLYDRLSGMAALLFLACLLAIGEFPRYALPLAACVAFCWPAFYVFTRFLFPKFLPVFLKGNGYSIGVQLVQVIAVLFILQAVHTEKNEFAYFLVFLCSSVAAALPLTIGGIGARELVFIYGSAYLGINGNTGFAVSLIFFLLTAFSSLAGILFTGKTIFGREPISPGS